MVRQTVAWVADGIGQFEYGDPANALKEAAATDPELELLTGVLDGIGTLMGAGWFETKDLYKKLNHEVSFHDEERPARTLAAMQAERAASGDLKELLEELTPSGKLSSRGLGRILGYRVDRIAGGKKLVKLTGGAVARFRLEQVEE